MEQQAQLTTHMGRLDTQQPTSQVHTIQRPDTTLLQDTTEEQGKLGMRMQQCMAQEVLAKLATGMGLQE